jgi:hypothetical protein
MKMIELIEMLKDKDKAIEFFKKELPEVDFEEIDCFLINNISPFSEVKFFNAEMPELKRVMMINNTKYFNLFPLSVLKEMIEDWLQQFPNVTNEKIAQGIIGYLKAESPDWTIG